MPLFQRLHSIDDSIVTTAARGMHALVAGATERDAVEWRLAARGMHALVVGVLLLLLLLPLAASAQTDPAAPPQNAPGTVEPQPSHRPGFLDALGRWFGGSADAVGSGLRSTGETLGVIGGQAAGAAKGAVGVAQDAAGTVAAIPGTRIVTGRQVCPLAPNGAPDCAKGVETLCRNQGFTGGRTLDIATSQRCSARAWLEAGGKRGSLCPTETYVTRAVCQ